MRNVLTGLIVPVLYVRAVSARWCDVTGQSGRGDQECITLHWYQPELETSSKIDGVMTKPQSIWYHLMEFISELHKPQRKISE